jgi:hypothetical protein
MEEKISLINNDYVKKRIKHEIHDLISKNICTENGINIIKENEEKTIIGIKNMKDNKYYEFIITNYYPFRSPKIRINNRCISFYHNIKSSQFRNSLIKYTGIECFCCETILNNWVPVYKIIDIFNDINKFRNATRQIIDRIIVNVIKRKYLNKDINIIEWLYY